MEHGSDIFSYFHFKKSLKTLKMFNFQLKKKKKKKKRDRDFSIISVGRERAIKQVFFLGLIERVVQHICRTERNQIMVVKLYSDQYLNKIQLQYQKPVHVIWSESKIKTCNNNNNTRTIFSEYPQGNKISNLHRETRFC